MPKLEQENSSMPTSLHYALTDSQCSVCGGQLEWKADFDNINQPKYVSQHCNLDYAINIETVKVEILGTISNDKHGQEQQQKNIMSTNKEDDEPKALQMAEAMKRQQQQEKEGEE